MPRESTRARVRSALALARREHRKVFVEEIAGAWEDRARAGEVIHVWLDSPPFWQEWARLAGVGEYSDFTSGHCRLQRIW